MAMSTETARVLGCVRGFVTSSKDPQTSEWSADPCCTSNAQSAIASQPSAISHWSVHMCVPSAQLFTSHELLGCCHVPQNWRILRRNRGLHMLLGTQQLKHLKHRLAMDGGHAVVKFCIPQASLKRDRPWGDHFWGKSSHGAL